MLWVLLIASLVGLLAAPALIQQPNLQPWLSPTIDTLSLWHSIWAISMTLGVFVLLVWGWYRRRYAKGKIAGSLLGYASVLLLGVLASSSYGVYRQLDYQAHLLTAPLTVDATVTVTQISDTINDTAGYGDHQVKIGSNHSQQVWQLTRLATPDNTIRLPMTVLVSANLDKHPDWQQTLRQLAPGHQLTVKLALQPIRPPQMGILPPNARTLDIGFDEALWLQTQHVQAKAQLLAIDAHAISNDTTGYRIEALRWALRQRLLHRLRQVLNQSDSQTHATDNIDSYAILLGLLTGDRALLGSDIKQQYQITGISHLLAISGPHVLMLASLISLWVVWLIKACLPSILIRMPSRLIMLWVSVVVAGLYALLVGFELPAQRTFWMLLGVTLGTQALMVNRPYRLLAGVALIMMWYDTTAVLQAGFWLSFVAVGLLLRFSQTAVVFAPDGYHTLVAQADLSVFQRLARYALYQLGDLFKLQLWLFIWMMPIVLWFFGKVSVISVLVNLVAVPLIGLVIVPLDMLAGILSLIPEVGYYISSPIWSLLAGILTAFHGLLAWLIKAGWATQAFIALTPSQLLLSLSIIGIVLARGRIPKIFSLPLILIMVALNASAAKTSETTPILTLLDHTPITVALLVQGNTAWLILSDNQNLSPPLPQSKTAQNNHSSPKQIAVSNASAGYLLEDIRQLLAKSHVTRLSGVISQTPSAQTNKLIQRLAQEIPISAYWLAGYDPLHALTDTSGRAFDYPAITPSACQTGLSTQNLSTQKLSIPNTLTIKAVTGWPLDLPLQPEERLATQSCFIQIQANSQQHPAPYNVLLTAGHSVLPLQMGEKLCNVPTTDLLVQAYQTPLTPSWLGQAKPKQVHLISGQQDYQALSEASHIALLDVIAQHNVSVVDSQRAGVVQYQLVAKQ